MKRSASLDGAESALGVACCVRLWMSELGCREQVEHGHLRLGSLAEHEINGVGQSDAIHDELQN